MYLYWKVKERMICLDNSGGKLLCKILEEKESLQWIIRITVSLDQVGQIVDWLLDTNIYVVVNQIACIERLGKNVMGIHFIIFCSN